MRVVFDTNIFISGLRFGGKPEALLQMAARTAFVLVVSEEILLELEEVLLRKFRWSRRKIALTLESIRTISETVRPDITLTDCEDQDDNRILEAAVAGRATIIVSGDHHLLKMRMFRGIEIMRIGDFLNRIELSD